MKRLGVLLVVIAAAACDDPGGGSSAPDAASVGADASPNPGADAASTDALLSPDVPAVTSDGGADDATPTDDDGGEPTPDAGAADAAVGVDAGGRRCWSHADCPSGQACVDDVCRPCGGGPDCDMNGTADLCEIASGAAEDCDDNGVPDRCDLMLDSNLDCNMDQVPDHCQQIEGCTLQGRNDYITYVSGTLPIVLSAPHGGRLRPTEIPDRMGGTQVTDTNTAELARNIRFRFRDRYGRTPHLIICNLARVKIDANRDAPEATEGNPFAMQAWREFHVFIDAAKRAVDHQYARGLYVDVHGLARSRTELGYLLSGTQLELDDARLNHPGYARRSSLRTVAAEINDPFSALVRGSVSFGTLLQNEGYPSIPSTGLPSPGRDASGDVNPFFNGGYNTVRHTSRNGGSISGFQIETPFDTIRRNEDTRRRFAESFVRATGPFALTHFGLHVGAPQSVWLEARQPEALEGSRRARIAVRRRGDLTEALRVRLDYQGDADVTSRPSDVRFAAGADIEWIDLTPVDDQVARGPTRLTVLVEPDADYNLREPSVAHVTVLDDERAGVSIEAIEPRMAEDRFVGLTLRRSVTADALTVPLRYAGEAMEGADFNGPATARFETGAEFSQVVLQGIDDSDVEGHERLQVAIDGGPDHDVTPSATATITVDDNDLPAELQLWWSTRREGDRWIDVSGQGRSAALMPAGANGPTPAPRGGVSFDGIDDVAVVDTFSLGDRYTIAFAFRVPTTAPERFAYVMSWNRLSRTHSLNIYLTTAGTLRTALRGGDDEAAYSALDVTGNHRDGQWHHYALTFDGTVAKVHIDGAEAATARRGGARLEPPDDLFVGGRYDLSDTRHFSGDLADVRFLRRALSATEIRALAGP